MRPDTDLHVLKQVLLRALGFDLLQPPSLEDETPLFGDDGLCLDSIDAMAISTAVLKTYGVNLEDHAACRPIYLASCKALWDFIQAKQNEQPHVASREPVG